MSDYIDPHFDLDYYDNDPALYEHMRCWSQEKHDRYAHICRSTIGYMMCIIANQYLVARRKRAEKLATFSLTLSTP